MSSHYIRPCGSFSVCQNCLRLKSELAFLYFFFLYSNVYLGFSTDTCRPSVCCRRLSLWKHTMCNQTKVWSGHHHPQCLFTEVRLQLMHWHKTHRSDNTCAACRFQHALKNATKSLIIEGVRKGLISVTRPQTVSCFLCEIPLAAIIVALCTLWETHIINHVHIQHILSSMSSSARLMNSHDWLFIQVRQSSDNLCIFCISAVSCFASTKD